MTTRTISAADRIRTVFNGPLIAGIGATTDAGLSRDMYHRVPWDPKNIAPVNIIEDDVGTRFSYDPNIGWGFISDVEALRWAKYNVDVIYRAREKWDTIAAMSEDYKDMLRRDMITILYVAMSHNYYLLETAQATKEESQATKELTADDMDVFVNVATLNRAATWIMARMHTKYQTNHVLGGTPMQASMASVARALLGIGETRTTEARNRYEATASALHWVLHPLNEQLLIPVAIVKTHIRHAMTPIGGPPPVTMMVDEYFQIRATTPPASTHHFYVCSAAIRHLDPLGILQYLPQPSRMLDISTGWLMIAAHGAALHPAARFWGLKRISANQKLLEPLAADLGYAVRKIMPGSSLAASPILAKEDQLDGGWKTLVDAIRSAMDKKGEELLDPALIEEVKKAIAPTKGDVTMIPRIKAYLTGPDAIKQSDIDKFLEGQATDESTDDDGTDDDEDDAGDHRGDGGGTPRAGDHSSDQASDVAPGPVAGPSDIREGQSSDDGSTRSRRGSGRIREFVSSFRGGSDRSSGAARERRGGRGT